MSAKSKKPLLVITTCADKNSAKKLSDLILKAKLAACIQLDSINSFYSWQGKICADEEVRLMIKTGKKCYKKLEQLISKNHNYDNPEIIALTIKKGVKNYLDWLKKSTTN